MAGASIDNDSGVVDDGNFWRSPMSDAFLADTVDTTRLYSRVVDLRFCGVLCIARSVNQAID